MPRKSTYKTAVKRPYKKRSLKTYKSLSSAIKQLQAKDAKQTQYLNYGQTVNSNLSGPVEAFHLTNTNSWNVIFGTEANDADCNKVIYKGLGMDLYFQSNNETAQITFTVFLVSLTDLIGQNFNVGSGALSLVNNFHYVVQGSQVLINKKCFNIHKVKRFTLGNHGAALSTSAAQTQYGTDKRLYFKVPKNQVFQNPYGDWKPIPAQLDPNKNMYLLVFNDNSALDLENPTMQMNVVHTVQKNL